MEIDIPKNIWFMWLQGIGNAPLVVKKCHESWVAENPHWQINFLNDTNLHEYINIPRPENATDQAWSDVVRINLLAKYGGVWVDATVYCLKPLDEWLPGLLNAGFFAFARPGVDRMISSWFIASTKESYITTAYQHAVNDYWRENPDVKPAEDNAPKFLKRNLARMGPQTWFTRLVRKLLKIYPYFWFHYLFEYVYLRDRRFKDLWDACPTISSDIPHRLQFAGLFNKITEEVKAEIDSGESLLYKLSWKFEPGSYKEGCVMSYLLERK